MSNTFNKHVQLRSFQLGALFLADQTPMIIGKKKEKFSQTRKACSSFKKSTQIEYISCWQETVEGDQIIPSTALAS